jgi:hypothetical protein
MAAGLPPIVADFDGYKDTVTFEVGVRVTTRWNPDQSYLSELGSLLYERPLHLLLGQSVEVDLGELEEAIVTLSADDRRRAEMSRRAAEHARAQFDWRAVIPGYEAVWRRLAARPQPPTRPARDRHPLAMSFGDIFGHYPSEALPATRMLARSDVARALCDTHNGYVIYPELKTAFSGDDVMAALGAIGDAPVTVADLMRTLEGRFAWAPAWRASLLVTWLIKHGLLR